MAITKTEERLAYLAFNLLFPDDVPSTLEEVEEHDRYQQLLEHISSIWPSLESAVRNTLDTVQSDLERALTERTFIHRALMSVLADSMLADLAATNGVDPAPPIPDDELAVRLAGARIALGAETASDRETIDEWLASPVDDTGDGGDPDDNPFRIDTRNLPLSFDEAAQRRFLRAVLQLSHERELDVDDPVDVGQIAYILGSLLRASFYGPDSPGFADAFSDEYNKGYKEVETTAKGRYIAREGYYRIRNEIRDIKDGTPTVQEVAAVSDDVLDSPPVDDNFRAKVRAAHTDFVAREPSYDTLDLPDLITDDTAQSDVEPTNVRAVSMIYAAGHLESLIQACDLIAQDWTDGYIPVGTAASNELDEYVWDARQRLDASAREIQTDKIRALDTHLMRFCSATSERDRAKYLSEYLKKDSRRTTSQPGDAAVRKAARDLLAFASLHGWAYAQSSSKRLGNQIRVCTAIVSNLEIQKAYGVTGPWQLVERVHQMGTGIIPPVAKERTLASTGKEIIDMLATKSKSIVASVSSVTLFPTDDGSLHPKELQKERSIFIDEEYRLLLIHVENWLAAKGINDNERVTASRISDSGSAPSLPNFGGNSGFGGSGFDANAARDQLMQMAASGGQIDVGTINQLFNIGMN